ncbi:MAG: GTPase HflX [Vicinamibacteria bacterium]|nr:GTPase HflX [Vicinamibacteria bacterium]
MTASVPLEEPIEPELPAPPRSRRAHVTQDRDQQERAILIGVAISGHARRSVETSLDELGRLAQSAGATVVARVIQARAAIDSATFIGRGKLQQLVRLIAAHGANLIVFDDNLSPGQQRNIEEVLGCKVIDRTQLILDIFARRAHTREGQLQVELAQLNYLLPRLTGKGVLLSRLGGGIGTRGPGETKLETDRRRIRQRLQAVKRAIEDVRRHRRTRREARDRSAWPVVALIGYTNAGKSTLFNALTRGGAEVSDQLFKTLDPLVRRCRLGAGMDILLVDTVGFIRKLPHGLVAAFRATLEEVAIADLLLHVIDGTAENRAECEDAVVERLELSLRAIRLRVPQGDQECIGRLHAIGQVLSLEQRDGDLLIDARLPGRAVAQFQEYLQ